MILVGTPPSLSPSFFQPSWSRPSFQPWVFSTPGPAPAPVSVLMKPTRSSCAAARPGTKRAAAAIGSQSFRMNSSLKDLLVETGAPAKVRSLGARPHFLGDLAGHAPANQVKTRPPRTAPMARPFLLLT